MKIKFKLYASLSKHLPEGSVSNTTFIEIPPEASVYDVLVRHDIPRKSVHLVLINGIYIEPKDRDMPIFSDGDALALWPPVAGG